MAALLFTKAILSGELVAVCTDGAIRGDFMYIDDIVKAIVRITGRRPAAASEGGSSTAPATAPYRMFSVATASPSNSSNSSGRSSL